MAENKKSFIAYADWLPTFEELSDQEAGRLIKHILRYVNDQDPVTDDKIVKMCFIPIQMALKRDLKKYEAIRQNRVKAGQASARKRKQRSTGANNAQQRSASPTDNVSGNGTVNGIEEKEKISFDLFWESYDKKVGKKEKIKSKWDKLSIEKQKQILAYIPRYIDAVNDKKYRKNPETFLNNESWNDELIYNSNGLSSGQKLVTSDGKERNY